MPAAETGDLLRQLAPQVLGALVRRHGHFDTAEDAMQEALLAAATQWPGEGIPTSPRAWLITVASRRLTDLLRSEQARQRREDTVAQWTLSSRWLAPAADEIAGGAGPDSDDTLILLFLCCHPALSLEVRVAMTIRRPRRCRPSMTGALAAVAVGRRTRVAAAPPATSKPARLPTALVSRRTGAEVHSRATSPQ